MYVVKYGNQYIHDPFSDSQRAYDISISSDINASGTCEFTIGPSHPLYDELELRSSSSNVMVLEDDTVLFDGYIYSFNTNYDKSRDVTCYGCLSYLGDIRLRPYSTQKTDNDPPDMLYCSSTIDGLFEFYIDQYNKYADEGHKFLIGTNEGSVIRELNSITASSDSYPTVSDELSEKLLNDVGGYVFIHHDGGTRYIDYFANCTDVNAQIVDFGVNIIDFVKTDTMSEFYTALRPVGGTPNESEGESKKFPISLNLINDGHTDVTGILKKGDVVYDEDAVMKYGYIEGYKSYSEITDVEALQHQAAVDVQIASSIHPTIEVKAIDLALYKQGNKPLVPGQLVRVRSIPHGIDEYLLLNNMDIDISDPSNTVYTFGAAIDSLTGEQNKKAAELNASINHSLDAVAELDQTTKDQAIQIGKVEDAANDASEKADNAQNTANNAQNTANNAQNTANSNKEEIDSIKDAQTEYEKQLEQMQQGVADATEGIGQVNKRIEGMNSEIESAKSDIDSLRSSTETELQNVKQSVSDVQSDVDAVTQKASDLASDLDGTKATVEQVTTDLGEVKTTVSNAATKADQALQVSTSASQTATEAKTTATSAYQDAQSALTQSSIASQTANAVKTELETKYSTTDEIAQEYATKSLVEQTSQSITSTVEATYATKATVEALENIANNAVQTWMGFGVPTLSNKPASDWNTAELKSQHSGDIYYDSDTGYSYRFGSSDGKNYSWSLIKDTDISKAVADAAKAQQTAEGVSDEVTQLKTDIPATYATKTEVKQTTDSIKSTVSEVASTANSALSKATTVEQTANGLQTTVTEQAEKLEGAVTTISQVSQKADSLSSKIEQTNANLDVALSNGFEIIRNPNGDASKGNLDGWNGVVLSASGAPSGCPISTYMKITTRDTNWGYESGYTKRPCRRGRTYRIEAYVACDNTATKNSGFGLSYYTVSGSATWVKAFTVTPTQGKTWVKYSGTVTVPENVTKEALPWIQIDGSAGSTAIGWYYTGLSVTDITEAKTANDTANSALSQSSTVQQELTSFKTSVQQTYETKNDALSKQSSLQQSVNNLRTEVSETYTTKTEFENLQVGGTNLVKLGGYAFNGNLTNTSYNKDDDLYKFTVPANLSDNTWGYGINQRGIGYVYAGIPWQRYGILSFYIHADRACTINIDANTQAFAGSTGATSGGNDHDTTGSRAHSSYSIPANQWTQVWMRWLNSNPNASTGNPNKVDLYDNSPIGIKSQSSDINVQIKRIKFEEGTKPTDWSPCPADMLTSDQAAQTYSTKSYVDQTARTVSLGVVEEYKDGQHGSALATQSDITAAKDSITSTVSQTYATKNDVGVGNLIKNGDFSDGSSNWTTIGGTSKVVDGTYGKQFVFTQTGTNTNGSNRIYNPSYSHINGQAYEVSFYAKADKSSKWHFGPNNSSKAASVTLDTTLKQYTMQYQADGTTVLSVWTDNPTATIHLERVKLSIASGYYATKTEVKQTSDSLTVTISSAVSKAESAATAASNAQNTANTANTNATNANNRVGNLETCIKMTSDGVRVGKISNGNFTGYSALVNSEGSFDVLDSNSNIRAKFMSNGLSFYNPANGAESIRINASTNGGTNAIQIGSVNASGNMISAIRFADGDAYNGLDIGANYGTIKIHGTSVEFTTTTDGVIFDGGLPKIMNADHVAIFESGIYTGNTSSLGTIMITTTGHRTVIADSVIVSICDASGIPDSVGRLLTPVVWSRETGKFQVRFRRLDTNSWVTDAQRVSVSWLAIYK